jgi:hypothetical protein
MHLEAGRNGLTVAIYRMQPIGTSAMVVARGAATSSRY